MKLLNWSRILQALAVFAIGLLSIENVLLLDISGAVIAIVALLFIHIPSPPKENKN